jgi:TRAP-type C4-dicarboxylate transport system permease small subunit
MVTALTVCVIFLTRPAGIHSSTIMGIVMSFQVVSRSIFGKSMIWSEELTRHVFIWTTFIGMSYGIKKLTHINLDYFIKKMAGNVRNLVSIVVDVVTVIAFASLFYYGIIYTVDQMEILAPTMGYPMGFVMLALPAGCALSILSIISRWFVRRSTKPQQEVKP